MFHIQHLVIQYPPIPLCLFSGVSYLCHLKLVIAKLTHFRLYETTRYANEV